MVKQKRGTNKIMSLAAEQVTKYIKSRFTDYVNYT